MAGLNHYRLRDTRHTHASHLVWSGLSLEIVSRLLGHTNPLTTICYAHLADDPLRAAAERIGSKVTALRERRKAEIVAFGAKDAGAKMLTENELNDFSRLWLVVVGNHDWIEKWPGARRLDRSISGAAVATQVTRAMMNGS